MRDLSAGMNGPDVRALQEGLNLRNDGVAAPIAVDGSFGPETDKAIRAYQARQQLKTRRHCWADHAGFQFFTWQWPPRPFSGKNVSQRDRL
jgi:Putative peptidoglycan binding domain